MKPSIRWIRREGRIISITTYRKIVEGDNMNCPRCGTPMSGGVCPECGFPINCLLRMFENRGLDNEHTRTEN